MPRTRKPRTTRRPPTMLAAPAAPAHDGLIHLQQGAALASGVKVDRETGVVSNVAIITAGPALGHGFDVDDVMLQQVERAINKRPKPVPVHLTHDGVWREDPLMVLVGHVAGRARIEGDAVRADIKLAKFAEKNPGGNLREFLFSIIEEAPGQVGLSIVFEPDKFEENRKDDEGRTLIPAGRLKSLSAVDFVGDPAANPNGLLHAPKPSLSGDSDMNPKLRKILEALGLPAAATDEEALAFAEKHLKKSKVSEALRKELAQRQLVTLEASDDEALQFVKDLITNAQGVGEGGDEGDGEGGGEGGEPMPGMNAGKGRKKPLRQQPQDPAQIAANAIAEERKRQQHIRGVAQRLSLGDTWAQQQIDGGFEVSAVNENAIKTLEKRTAAGRFNPGDLHVGEDRNLSTIGPALADAIIQRTGARTIVDTDSTGQVKFESKTVDGEQRFIVMQRQPHERSREFRGMTLLEMGKAWIAAHGGDVSGLSRSEIAKTLYNRRKLEALGIYGHSTSDFPSILADVATKTLRAAYTEVPAQWPIFCRRTTAPDFKQVSRTQLGEVSNLREVKEGAEIKHVTIGDAKEVFTLATYAEIFTQTWQSIINDDLNAFTRIPQLMGSAAKRKEDQLAFAVLTANAAMQDGQNLFSSAHANIISGTPAGPPSVATLNAMTALLMKQTGLSSDVILDLMPAIIIGPAALRGTILELIESTFKPGGNQENNIWAGKLTPVISARLDATSAVDWYLFASPTQIDTIEVCFLEDEPAPVLDEEDGFDVLGRKYSVRHTLAAAAIDHRGMAMMDD